MTLDSSFTDCEESLIGFDYDEEGMNCEVTGYYDDKKRLIVTEVHMWENTIDGQISGEGAEPSHRVSDTALAEKDAEIARLRGALEYYACEANCWADSMSGNNPLIGKPNTPFCHKEQKDQTCGKIAKQALEKTQ